MIRKLTRSTLAMAGMAALFLAGACSTSSPADNPLVDDQAEVRPFTEKGYDPTQSAPEVADANNDGITDTSTSTPRNGEVLDTRVVVTEEPVVTFTETSEPIASSTTTTTTTQLSTTQTSPTSTTITETTTTVPMTSSSQVEEQEEPAPTRQRLRKD